MMLRCGGDTTGRHHVTRHRVTNVEITGPTNSAKLPVIFATSRYTGRFHFGVDTNANGVVDFADLFFDSLEVTVN